MTDNRCDWEDCEAEATHFGYFTFFPVEARFCGQHHEQPVVDGDVVLTESRFDRWLYHYDATYHASVALLAWVLACHTPWMRRRTA